ncbi:unnamed protein product, partial [Staurois parvus]
MGPATDPGPSGSAQVSKWSVHPCLIHNNKPKTGQRTEKITVLLFLMFQDYL